MVTINLPSTKEESTEENGAHCESYPSLTSHEHDKTKIKIKITYIRQDGNNNIAGKSNDNFVSTDAETVNRVRYLERENELLAQLVKILTQ